MFCKKCGHENSEDSAYCKNCGINLKKKLIDENHFKKPISRFMYSIFACFVLITSLGLYFMITDSFWAINKVLILQFVISCIFVYIVMNVNDSFFKAVFYGILSAMPYLIISYLTTFPLLVPAESLIIILPLIGILGSIFSFYVKKKSHGRLEQQTFNYFITNSTKNNGSINFNELRTSKLFLNYQAKIFRNILIFLTVLTVLGSLLGYSPIIAAANAHDYPTLANYLEHGSKQEQITTMLIITLGETYFTLDFPANYNVKIIKLLQNKIESNSDADIRYSAVYAISANLVFLNKNEKNAVITTLQNTAKSDSNAEVRNAASENLKVYYDTLQSIQSISTSRNEALYS
jgi:transcription initiation factor TFIIIB Brf1 subunit/transcription initiation factor TFIIB